MVEPYLKFYHSVCNVLIDVFGIYAERKMIVLGIDPSLCYTGFSVIKQEGRTTALLDYGCLTMSSSQSVQQRIGIFYHHMHEKIIQWHVTVLVLETPFLGKNAQNFLKLGYLRGIVYLLAEIHHLTLHEFSPREIKQALTGFGGADKEQIARIIHQLFPRLPQPVRHDTTDAIAIALCGLWRKNSIFTHRV